MKKTIFLSLITIAAVTASFSLQRRTEKTTLSDTQLANIEALSMEEHDPCNNYNGYRRILSGDEKIYDCCYKEQIGKGKDDCKRW